MPWLRQTIIQSCQGQKEIDPNGVSVTIRAEHHGNIEYRRLSLENGGKNKRELNQGKKQRRLTVRECGRLQSFPDTYPFVIRKNEKRFLVSGSEAYKLVGNAVPPLLAFNIGVNIADKWDNWFKG